jgi:hypothetical protein
MTALREPRCTARALRAEKKGFRLVPALGVLSALGLALLISQRDAASLSTAQANQTASVQAAGAQDRGGKASAAGKKFLQLLDDKQRAKAVLDFGSAKKAGWSNLPITNVPRNGVRLGDLTLAQRDAAMELLAVLLSKEGYQKVIDIMNADEELASGKAKGKGGKGGKGGGKTSFGNDNYFLALFGEPSATKPWLVQFGGHHLGVNVTIAAKSFVLTPTHTGVQPASYTRDGKTIRPLGPENDKAFELIAMLDEKQKEQVILANKAGNLVLGPGKDGKRIEPQGVKASALTDGQKSKLLELIGEWVNIINEDSASSRMDEIKAKLSDTYFAWSGPTAKGSAAYFRVQGPTLVIEYAPQGGTDHIHTIIRDPSNDYGEKLLRENAGGK